MGTISPRGLGAVFLTLMAVAATDVAAQVSVTLQQLYPVEAVFVSDFTPHTIGQNPELLAVTLMGDRDQSVVLELTVRMVRPQQELVLRASTNAFEFRGPVRRITNRELATSGRDVSFGTYEVGRESERILQTGMLAAGTYSFNVMIRTPQGVELDQAELQIQLGNPSRVELLSPGRPVSESAPVVSTPSPRFQWSTDGEVGGAGVAQYRLKVVRADGASSGEEAMQGFAAWETVTPTTSVLYPGSAAALPLDPGGTYAWQVTREVRTSGGVERLESQIHWFRMAGGAGGLSGSGGEQGVGRRMEELLRGLGLGADLTGFATVRAVRVDGRTASVDGVEELLAAIASGEVRLLSIRVR